MTALRQLDRGGDRQLLAEGCPLNDGGSQKRTLDLMFSPLAAVGSLAGVAGQLDWRCWSTGWLFANGYPPDPTGTPRIDSELESQHDRAPL